MRSLYYTGPWCLIIALLCLVLCLSLVCVYMCCTPQVFKLSWLLATVGKVLKGHMPSAVAREICRG